jgi:hypothetical protein
VISRFMEMVGGKVGTRACASVRSSSNAFVHATGKCSFQNGLFAKS